HPLESYTEMTKLTVGIDPKLDPELRDQILRSLRECSTFTEVTAMDKPVRVSGSNPKDYFDALIKRSPQAQTSQGIMSVQIEDNTQNSQLDKSQALVFADQPTSDWYPSYGVPILGTIGFPSLPEMAPQWKMKKRDTYVRSERSQFIVRFALYNRVSGKMVHDRLISNQSLLQNYSRKPTLKKAKFQKIVERSVIDEVMFFACPAKDLVKRKLYYMAEPDALGLMSNEGVELAEDDRWPLAATKWNNVLLKDAKHAIAHHNLGVYFERQGDVFKAIEHFKSARQGPLSRLLPDRIYEELRSRYLPKLDGASFYPQVAFVTGGNWVYIQSPDAEMQEKRNYSLYRIEPIINPDSSRTTGLAIREVGVVRVFPGNDRYYTGRLREFLFDQPVKPGDFVIAE
ncbi:MAG: hypothetical protein ACOVS5_07820, partial [Oligoflexus sp.]